MSDQDLLAECAARGDDVSCPPIGRYAHQLLGALAREFQGGGSWTRQSMLDEIRGQLVKANGQAPAEATVAKVSRAAFDELLINGLCVLKPTAHKPKKGDKRWQLTERGELAALGDRVAQAEAWGEAAVSFEIAQLEAPPVDLEPEAGATPPLPCPVEPATTRSDPKPRLVIFERPAAPAKARYSVFGQRAS